MLSAFDQGQQQQASIETNELDFQASPTSVIDARQLKFVVKTGGHKLSSNAFEALNTFARQLTMALAIQCTKISRSEGMDDLSSLGGFGSGISTMGAPILSDNLPWSLVMEAVRCILPALEGWFANWYERLVQHVDLAHSSSFPSEMPCCKEISDSGTALIRPVLLISDFKGILSRHSLSVNWYAMSAICCSINEILQWTVGVAMKMMDAKGVGTLKRADVQGIVEKAPVFQGLQPYLDAVRPLYEASEQRRTTETSCFSLPFRNEPHDYSINGHLSTAGQRTSTALCEPSPAKPVAEEMSVAELARLVNERLNPSKSAAPPAPPQTVIEPKPSPTDQKQTRYVICTDRQFPWMQVCQGETAVFVQSSGVQTDAIHEAPSLDRASCEAEMQRLQSEIESLKALLLKLLATSH
jgi:hypothetical protein